MLIVLASSSHKAPCLMGWQASIVTAARIRQKNQSRFDELITEDSSVLLAVQLFDRSTLHRL
jgi:hypothetical protein